MPNFRKFLSSQIDFFYQAKDENKQTKGIFMWVRSYDKMQCCQFESILVSRWKIKFHTGNRNKVADLKKLFNIKHQQILINFYVNYKFTSVYVREI